MLIERSALTFGPVVIRIEALALAAVRYTSRAPTAIASVPVTAAVVVFACRRTAGHPCTQLYAKRESQMVRL